MHGARRSAAALLLGALSATGLAACSAGPSAQVKACDSRSAVLRSATELRSFDYTRQDAASLSGLLDSVQSGLTDLHDALPADRRARAATLAGELYDLVQGIGGDQSAGQGGLDLSELRSSIDPRVNEAADIASTVTGC